MPGHVVFLSGPIGAGKTTLGRALAAALAGGFIDGDDHAAPGRPWYASILTTCRAILHEGDAVLRARPVVVVAYPLDCMNWIYFRRRFAERGAGTVFVSLRASYAAIVDPARGRTFSPAEHRRIQTMLAEGYGARGFSDLVLDTDQADFHQTLGRLTEAVRALIGR